VSSPGTPTSDHRGAERVASGQLLAVQAWSRPRQQAVTHHGDQQPGGHQFRVRARKSRTRPSRRRRDRPTADQSRARKPALGSGDLTVVITFRSRWQGGWHHRDPGGAACPEADDRSFPGVPASIRPARGGPRYTDPAIDPATLRMHPRGSQRCNGPPTRTRDRDSPYEGTHPRSLDMRARRRGAALRRRFPVPGALSQPIRVFHHR